MAEITNIATEGVKEEEEVEKMRKCRGHVARFSGKYGLKVLQWSRGLIDQEEAAREEGRAVLEDVTDDEAVECPEFETMDIAERVGEVTAKRLFDDDKESFLERFFTVFHSLLGSSTGRRPSRLSSGHSSN